MLYNVTGIYMLIGNNQTAVFQNFLIQNLILLCLKLPALSYTHFDTTISNLDSGVFFRKNGILIYAISLT